jgi:hypothetical protein
VVLHAEVSEYWERSLHYWEQSVDLLERRELEKASEIAWGAVVEAIKALALQVDNKHLASHREVRQYLKALATRSDDRQLYELFVLSEKLHINFYDAFFEDDEVRHCFSAVRQLLQRIEGYLKST